MDDRTNRMINADLFEAELRAGKTVVTVLIQRLKPDGEYEQLDYTEPLHPQNAATLNLVCQAFGDQPPAHVFYYAVLAGLQLMVKEIAGVELVTQKRDWRDYVRRT